jgi:excisionase family DNA binding protein
MASPRQAVPNERYLRCPNCGHPLAAIDAPVALSGGHMLAPAGEPPPPLLLRVSEAARLLSISRTGMYGLIGTGQVRAIHVGRSVRISRGELDRFLAEQQHR